MVSACARIALLVTLVLLGSLLANREALANAAMAAAASSANAGIGACSSNSGKAQALSGISQCRALISGALRQVCAIGGKYVEGWGGGGGGGAGLEAISGVLGRAAVLIQSKG
ncbi:MAG: hypothetical protein JWR80_222 [Bradyrhizobium sp.]|nr:hypothetical protein [Bradyrhizobium sp.]